MKRTWLQRILGLALVGAAALVSAPAASPDPFPTNCFTADNARAVYLRGYGGYCADNGGVCSECSTGFTGGHIVCVSDSFGTSVCTDYQD
jgi:hypothetical protein